MNLTSKFKFNNLLIIYDLLRNGYSQKFCKYTYSRACGGTPKCYGMKDRTKVQT